MRVAFFILNNKHIGKRKYYTKHSWFIYKWWAHLFDRTVL